MILRLIPGILALVVLVFGMHDTSRWVIAKRRWTKTTGTAADADRVDPLGAGANLTVSYTTPDGLAHTRRLPDSTLASWGLLSTPTGRSVPVWHHPTNPDRFVAATRRLTGSFLTTLLIPLAVAAYLFWIALH